MDILVLNKINGHEDEVEIIKELSKTTKSIRMYKRYSVILKYFDVLTNRKIAEMENIDEHTVGIYIKNYKSKGLDGLNFGRSSGAKIKLNTSQEKRIVETVTMNTPDQVGFESRKTGL